jgi:hypothetical protein
MSVRRRSVEIEISEDRCARSDFARGVATSIFCRWRFHAAFVLIAAALSIGFEVVARSRGHSPPLSESFLLFFLVALIGVVLSGVAYLSLRFLPPQRWILRPDRISLRGREIGFVKYRDLDSFEVKSIQGPPGSTFFAVYCSNGRAHTLIAGASSPASAAEDELSRRLTRRCS